MKHQWKTKGYWTWHLASNAKLSMTEDSILTPQSPLLSMLVSSQHLDKSKMYQKKFIVASKNIMVSLEISKQDTPRIVTQSIQPSELL